MNIKISREATVGKAIIPPGDYWVSLNPNANEIHLLAGGKTIALPAKKRRSQSKSKTTSVQFYCGGGRSWSLVVSVPKLGEWLVLLELAKTETR